MNRTPVIILLLFFIAAAGQSDSLWEEDFTGFLSESSSLREGQVVQVILDEETSFTYSSSSIGNKEIILELTGGETGDIFSFLPFGKSGETLNRKGSEDNSFKASIAARVIEIDESGMVFIRGRRSILFQNGEETISVEGWINPAAVDASFIIPFAQMADSKLFFSSFLDPSDDTVRPDELTKQEVSAPREGAEEAEEVILEGLEEGVLPLPEVSEASGYSLSEERKKELLLSYINRFLDLIFQLEE